MKIIKQTEEELFLKDGGISGIIGGIIFICFGFYLGYTLKIFSSSQYSNIWFPLILILVGLILLFTSSSINIAIEKQSGKIIYNIKRLIGSKSQESDIANVVRVELRKEWKITTNSSSKQGLSIPQRVLMSQSIIIFKDGSELAIDHKKKSSESIVGGVSVLGGQGREKLIANKIAEFLGVPFQEITPSTLGINGL
jgi:hypothetical protein